MLDIIMGRRQTQCDGRSRRDFLRVGALGACSLSTLLQHEAPSSETVKTKSGRRSVILVYLGGGISHHDTFDPKPDATPEIRGIYQTIDTSVAGLRISDKLPQLAMVMDKVALVRSGAHNNDHHET